MEAIRGEMTSADKPALVTDGSDPRMRLRIEFAWSDIGFNVY
jgi:hypothetical protein